MGIQRIRSQKYPYFLGVDKDIDINEKFPSAVSYVGQALRVPLSSQPCGTGIKSSP